MHKPVDMDGMNFNIDCKFLQFGASFLDGNVGNLLVAVTKLVSQFYSKVIKIIALHPALVGE